MYSIPLGDKSEPEFGSPTFDRLDAKGKICPDAIPWDSSSSSHKFYKKYFKLHKFYSKFAQIPYKFYTHCQEIADNRKGVWGCI